MVMMTDQNKTPGIEQIRSHAMETIRQHTAAIEVLAAAVAALDDAYWLAITERTQTDHQLLRDAKARLMLLLGEVSR